ncbi:MAG TPA: hypothetical protein VMG10_35835 [Gemmataceae bacterium]|nr:hypothetical protein [Gemmataceae bacterium]
MFIFFLPMIVGFTLLGCLIGFAVGRKAWGYTGGVLLGMILALAPALVGLAAGMCLLWRSNLLP